MCSIHYHYALIFVGHVLLHHTVGDLTPAHLLLQLTNPLCPSLHLLTQLERKGGGLKECTTDKKCKKTVKKQCNSVYRDDSHSKIRTGGSGLHKTGKVITLPEHCFPVGVCSPPWTFPDSSAVCRCSYCKLSELSVPGHKLSNILWSTVTWTRRAAKKRRKLLWGRIAPAHVAIGDLWFLHQMFSCFLQALLSAKLTKC